MAPHLFNHLHLKIYIFTSLSYLFCIFNCGFCKYIEGVLQTSQNWAFLTRFCFLSEVGRIQYHLQYPVKFEVENILLYYDEPSQWRSVYNRPDKSCAQKQAVLKPERYQIIPLTDRSAISGCSRVVGYDKQEYYRCTAGSYFISARERWWYIAISNCNSTKGLQLTYRIKMLNDDESNKWIAHFSADEMYILHMDLAFVIINFLLLAGSSYIAHVLKSRKLFHATYKLYMSSIAIQSLGVLLLCSSYAKYAKQGEEYPTLKLWGQLLQSVSVIIFILLILLIGKGYTVTRGKLRRTSSVRLSVFMVIYSMTYAILFIYQQEVFDPGEVLYIYESPAGYGLLILRLFGWCMLLYSVFFTLKHFPEKSGFYIPYISFYSAWFLSGPIVILLANHLIDNWVREKVVHGVELFIAFLGHLFFMILTRPSAANRNFPYHIRTSQIHAMEMSPNGVSGNCNIENFVHHPYEVSYDNSKHIVELFVVNKVYIPNERIQDDRPNKGRPSIAFVTEAPPDAEEEQSKALQPSAPPADTP